MYVFEKPCFLKKHALKIAAGQAFGSAVKTLLGLPVPLTGVSDLESWLESQLHSHSSFPLIHTWEAAGASSGRCVPVIHVGDPD